MAGFPSSRGGTLEGPVATAPTGGESYDDPRNTYGQPGSLDLPPALRGRNGGGPVSVGDRQRTLGTYAYNAAQDARTGGGIPSPNNPRGGQPGGDAIMSAGDMQPATPAMSWLTAAGKREPIDPVVLANARATLLGANGLVPGRTYSKDTLTKASPEQIMQEVANMGQRVNLGKLQQEQAGKRNETAAWQGTQAPTAPAGPLHPDHVDALFKAAGNVLASTQNHDLAQKITAIANPADSSSFLPTDRGKSYVGNGQYLQPDGTLGTTRPPDEAAPSPLPSDNSAPAAPAPSPLDVAQQAADRARETLNHYSAMAGENASPEHLRLLTQQHTEAREALAAAKAEDDRQRDRAEKLADTYGIPFDATKPGSASLAEINQHAQQIHAQNQQTATAANKEMLDVNGLLEKNEQDQVALESQLNAGLSEEEKQAIKDDPKISDADNVIGDKEKTMKTQLSLRMKSLQAEQAALVRRQRMADATLTSLRNRNVLPEDNPLGAPASAPAPAPAASGSVSIGDVVPNLNVSSQGAGWLSPAQAALLPSGATFTGSDGITRTKH